MNTHLNQFSLYLRRYKLSENSIKSYVYIITKLCREYPDAPHYSYNQIIDYLHHYTNRTERPSMSLLQSALKRYYAFLFQKKVIKNNPMFGIAMIQRKKPLIHDDLLTQDELNKLLNRPERYKALVIRNKLIVSLLIYQGLRLSELINLRIDDISFENETLRIKKQPNTLGRKLQLKPTQLAWFHKYLLKFRNDGQSNQSDSLFTNKLGSKLTPDDVYHLLSIYSVLFPNTRVTTTLIRQSVISYWINTCNIPVEQVQLLAGHKHISTTVAYRKPNMQALLTQVDTYHTLV